MYKFLQLLLIFSSLLVSSSSVSNISFPERSISVFSQEVNTSEVQFTNNSNIATLSQSLPEDFKKILKNQISKIFSDMLSKVDERYASQELGVQIDFPNGWQGTLIKPAKTLIVSPPEINVTDYLVNTTEKEFYSFINSIPLTKNTTIQDIIQTALNSVFNEVFKSLEQITPTISVSAISKDSIKYFQNLSGIEPPTKSVSSIWYDYTLAVMNEILGNLTGANVPAGSNEIKSINSSNINGIPTEIAVSESILPQSTKPFKTLAYLFLTQDNIINVEYSDISDNFNKYLPEFQKSVKTIKVTNPIAINEENIKRFVS